MSAWRKQLNQLAIEFWSGVGNMAEVSPWADIANEEMGEVHPDVWDLYTSKTPEEATSILLKIADDVNGFRPESWEAEAFAIVALQKALTRFLEKELSVQALCKLINTLDTVFVVGVPKEMGNPVTSPLHGTAWLGNLWNCCDWCDGTWTFENSQHVVSEARRVLNMLANLQMNTDSFAAGYQKR